ncbi:DUF4209 domain-containing protein [Shimia sp. R9_1]|uniref:DUF4209 domain-containing protein n=1 Tax=Shimia sp. R9_1 TaxID=2821111 RepID=UPI001ADA107B|nr:DUF4209 domain-containing protein [Shimia sp. R9_1]MBO9406185.1 DUF4209 domain-containing protein [Shimia sp. R9_1]
MKNSEDQTQSELAAPQDGEPQVPTPGVDFVVELDRLRDIDINSRLTGANSVDCHDINQIFSDMLNNAEPKDQPPLQLLAGLTNYHVDPDHRTEPFRPMFIFGDSRSLVPRDLLPEQIDLLAEIATEISNAGLRARLADVTWFVQRKRHNMAEAAISAYCDAVEQVQSGVSVFAFGDVSPWGVHAKSMLVRAARISHATRWKHQASKRLQELIKSLVGAAHKDGKVSDFVRIADVDIDHGITPVVEIAARAEGLVSADEIQANPDRKIDLWKTAARCHKRNRDEANHNRCMIEVAECHVQKAELADSPMLISAFLNDAVQILRNYPGTKDRRDELTRRLREVQPSIKDEMGSFSTEIDLSEIVEHSVASVRGHSWPSAFLSLALCDHPPEPDAIRHEASKHAEEFPLQGIMPMQVHDFQGRVVFRSPGLTGDAEEAEQHYRYLMSFHRGNARQVVVAGAIEPIRRVISEDHFVSADIVQEMIKDSPFIPPGHGYIFARAISQFLGGEDVEAASLLVPQLENSLRTILSHRGIDTTTTDENGIQTEASLPMLLNPANPWRERLEEILPERYTHEIDLLFSFPGGPSLRNQIAHGKVHVGGFWDHNMVYACWLIIHLAVLPLARRWGDVEETYVRVTGLAKPDDNAS